MVIAQPVVDELELSSGGGHRADVAVAAAMRDLFVDRADVTGIGQPVGGSAGRARARGDVFAERVNAAADLLDAGMPAADAARELASRFGCSPRQAHRYLQRRPVRTCCGARPGRGVHRQAAGAAHRAGPDACRRVGADAVRRGRAGVGGVLGAGASRASPPVSERVVETEFVFDRLQAAELSAAPAQRTDL